MTFDHVAQLIYLKFLEQPLFLDDFIFILLSREARVRQRVPCHTPAFTRDAGSLLSQSAMSFALDANAPAQVPFRGVNLQSHTNGR